MIFKKTSPRKLLFFIFLGIGAIIYLYSTIYGNFLFMRLLVIETQKAASNIYGDKIWITDYQYDSAEQLYIVNITDKNGLKSHFSYDPVKNIITDHYQADYNAYYKSLMTGKIINAISANKGLGDMLENVYIDLANTDKRRGIIGEGYDYDEPIGVTITLEKLESKEKMAECIYQIRESLYELPYKAVIIYASDAKGTLMYVLTDGLIPQNYLDIVGRIRYVTQ